jgi:hypothetical protein
MDRLASLSFASALISICVMTACVTAPPRTSPSAFKLIQESRIPAKDTQAFTDCLMDGFDVASFVFTTASVIQN